MMRWAGHVARIWKRDAYRILMGKPKGKRLLGRPGCMLLDNIKLDIREVGLGGIAWIDIFLDTDQWRTFVNMVMKLRFP
jgi:hypothetical protein